MQAPPITPEQLAIATQYMPPDQAMMAAAYLSPEALQYQLDNIEDNRGPELMASVIIVASLAATSVVVRLLCRQQMKVAISYDDYLIILGLVTRDVVKLLSGRRC